jgi:hypothetical protein
MEWSYYPGSTADKIYSSKDGGIFILPDKFGISQDVTVGRYDLVILNVSLDLGVKYECGFETSGQKKFAEFIAVDPLQCPPVGQEVLEGSNELVECFAYFHGAITPFVNWTDAVSEPSIVRTTNVTYSRMNVTFGAEHDAMEWVCQLEFTEAGAPDYTDNCTTYYYVLHGVRDIESFPPADENGTTIGDVAVGEQVTCTASGRPLPTFQWYDPVDGQLLSAEANLTATEEMIGLVTYTCFANNTVDGISYFAERNFTFNVYDPNGGAVTSNSVEPWVIAVAVVVPLVVLILAGIASFFIYRHYEKKKQKKKKGSASTTTPIVTTQTMTTTNTENQPFLYGGQPASGPPRTNASAIPPASAARYMPPTYEPQNMRNGQRPGSGSTDRDSAGFADLGGVRVPLGGSTTVIYTPAQPVNMRPNPMSYPYQPPPGVMAAGRAGSAAGSVDTLNRPAAAAGPAVGVPVHPPSISSHGSSSHYSGQPPVAGRVGYAGSHHSSLV